MEQNIDFAFEGFRIIRRQPVLIVFWGVLSLVLSGLMQWLMIGMMAPLLDQMMAMAPSGTTPSPTAAADATRDLALMVKMLPAYGLLLALSVIFYAMINCAVYRAVFEHKNSTFGYLRFGADELRQLAVMIMFFLVFLVFYFAAALGAGLLIGLLTVVTRGSAAAAMAGVSVVMLLVFAGLIWFMVRMSFYTVQTFDTGRINLFGSFKLTKGRFWILLAGYLVTLVMVALVSACFMAIFSAVTAAMGLNGVGLLGQMVGVGPKPVYSTLYASPIMIGYTLSSAFFLTPLMIGLLTGAPAAAYRGFHGLTTRVKAESVF